MPHCIIEYSKDLSQNLDKKILMKNVFDACMQINLFNKKDIKVRMKSYEYFLSGGLEKNFIHINIKILSGRSIDEKKLLAQNVLKEVNNDSFSDISISVEVNDMNKEIYSKIVKS
ncbi:MAG: 5-carboxymethyl-2-hydroxymuconate Delta-isomerase [Campylobacteraceae bacterium]|nr:5-carboxymethyl-2-hydroxymuconate Delta-isomerase [Campylobacteraceae bacterium]